VSIHTSSILPSSTSTERDSIPSSSISSTSSMYTLSEHQKQKKKPTHQSTWKKEGRKIRNPSLNIQKDYISLIKEPIISLSNIKFSSIFTRHKSAHTHISVWVYLYTFGLSEEREDIDNDLPCPEVRVGAAPLILDGHLKGCPMREQQIHAFLELHGSFRRQFGWSSVATASSVGIHFLLVSILSAKP
jgi:hypothetical protein